MTQIDFGWRVPDFPVDGSDGPAFLRQITETLDLAGGRFAAGWVADHVYPWAPWQAVATPTFECWTTLTFLAARYPELNWGTIVLCQSYRNPALLAKMTADLCTFVPGKVIFGIGAGWKADEYRAYNWPFPVPAIRIRQLEEALEIVKQLWTANGVTYVGEHYQVYDAFLSPKPNPLPPILIGGGGEQLTLKLVAKHADWWNLPGGTPENYARKLSILRRHCDVIGRDYERIRKSWLCEMVAVAPTEAEARRLAENSPFYRGPDIGLIGTPEQIIEQLWRWVAIGVTHFQLRFVDFPRSDGIQRFMDEVMPHVR